MCIHIYIYVLPALRTRRAGSSRRPDAPAFLITAAAYYSCMIDMCLLLCFMFIVCRMFDVTAWRGAPRAGRVAVSGSTAAGACPGRRPRRAHMYRSIHAYMYV